MRYLILLAFFTGCVSTPIISPEKPNKYDVGDCVQLKDPLTGKTDPRHKLIITKVLEDQYMFKWLLGDQWSCCDAQDVRFGAFKKFEKLTFPVKCPKVL